MGLAEHWPTERRQQWSVCLRWTTCSIRTSAKTPEVESLASCSCDALVCIENSRNKARVPAQVKEDREIAGSERLEATILNRTAFRAQTGKREKTSPFPVVPETAHTALEKLRLPQLPAVCIRNPQ